MYAKKSVHCALAVLSLLGSGVAYAVGEQNGRIEGTITEAQTGAPVPGATIRLSGRSLIGGARTITSGDDGRYELVEVPPGTYDLEYSYPGLKPTRRRVVVRLGEAVPLNVVWQPEVASAPEVTVVTEERHMTRPDTTQTGTVLSADTESKLATKRNYQDVAAQIAGVSDTAQRGIPNIKGGNRLQNRYLVDGMDITDSTTNNFSSQVNFDAIASMEVLTGGMEAQYNALGGVLNLNTIAGSDEFHLDTSLYAQNESFALGQFTGSQIYDDARPFATDPNPPNAFYQANLQVSGPIIKQKLWYSISFMYQYNATSTPAGPPLNVQHPPRTFHNFYPRLKLTWAPSQRHRVTLTANADPAVNYYRQGFNHNQLLPVADVGQTQGGAFTVLQWDYFASQNINTNVQAGFNFNHVYVSPLGQIITPDFGPRDPRFSEKNYLYEAERPRRSNSVDGTIWYNGSWVDHDRRYTVQLDPSLSFRGHLAGFHDVKVGLQNRFVLHHFYEHLPGFSRYTNNNRMGLPLEAGLCDDTPGPTYGMGCDTTSLRFDQNDFSNQQYAVSSGLFLQDRWKPFSRLTVLPGIRLDWGLTRNGQGETVSNLFGVSPRLGFAFDITGDQKTIFTAYYGRATEVAYLLPASRADVQAVEKLNRWDPLANSGKGGFVYESQSGGQCGYRLDPAVGGDPNGGAGSKACGGMNQSGGGVSMQAPHTDEVSLGLVREFHRNSVAGINYTYRRISNIWDSVEVNTIWDPSGYRISGYANGRPEKVSLFTAPDGNYRIYHGIDFTVESRPTPNWDFYAAYTLSWLYGPGADEVGTVGTGGSAFANPRQYQFYSNGFLPEDQRHQFKVHASYDWQGLTMGVNVSYASGFPLSKQYQGLNSGSLNKRSPQGTEPGAGNDPSRISEFRIPDTFVLNARLSYDFHHLIRQHIVVIADFFNLFNVDTPTGLSNVDGQNFGLANSGRQTPFRFQLGLRYLY